MNISTIKNLKQLANFLRCDEEFLAGHLADNYYIEDRLHPGKLPKDIRRFSVIQKLYLPKRDKRVISFREVYSVRTDTLKDVHKTLNTFLQELYEPPSAVHGYVKGRNIRTNAEMHLAKKNLLSVDIANFFPSISIANIKQILVHIGFSDFAAIHLSKVVTLNNFLPPGFNTSPTLSNFVVKNMDEQLMQLCDDKTTYTRYADDLYFSSNTDLPSLGDIEKIIVNNGFVLNPEKTKYMHRGAKQYVTGLTVFDHIMPRVTKKIKRNFRLELHYLVRHGLLRHTLKQLEYSLDQYKNDETIRSEVDSTIDRTDIRITGWLRFMNSVEYNTAQRFLELYKKVKS